MQNKKIEPTGWAGIVASAILVTLVVAVLIWAGWDLLVTTHPITYVQAVGAGLLIDLIAAIWYAFRETSG